MLPGPTGGLHSLLPRPLHRRVDGLRQRDCGGEVVAGVFRAILATCDPHLVNTATRAATDLNAATDLELRLPQKGGGKEGVMSDVGSLGGGTGLRDFHAHRRLLWRVARTAVRGTASSVCVRATLQRSRRCAWNSRSPVPPPKEPTCVITPSLSPPFLAKVSRSIRGQSQPWLLYSHDVGRTLLK